MLGVMMLVCLLAPGCATEGSTPARAGSRPFDSPSWWGSDPTCSPGCPPSLPAGRY